MNKLRSKKSGFLDLNINPERFGRDNDNRYTIEIFAEKSFNPKERSMSGDSRDLSLRVYYIGEEQEYGI